MRVNSARTRSAVVLFFQLLQCPLELLIRCRKDFYLKNGTRYMKLLGNNRCWAFCFQNTNRAAVELVQFFRRNGFRSCILKGQGNTLNYPDPYIRTSGDIDIWVEGGYEKVLPWARKLVGNKKFCYHHIEFRKINGVEVEVHYRPSFMNNLIHNRRMQKWFESVADEQFGNDVELPDGAGRVCVPTNGFNRIYQMSHISNHFFHEGGFGRLWIIILCCNRDLRRRNESMMNGC